MSRVAIVGAALSDCGRVDTKSAFELHYQAASRAIADAGLTKADIDGIGSTGMAKAAAGEVATQMAKEGIQLHGGIGYTWESDVHLYVRRLESDAILFGTPEHHRQVVAELIGV